MIKDEIKRLQEEVNRLEDNEIREMTSSEAIDLAIEELGKKDINKIPSWGFKEFDETFGLLQGGQLYAVGGITGTGKSTFINQICENVSKQGFRVSLYTLEDRIETIKQNQLFFAINRYRKQNNSQFLVKWKFMAGFYKNIPEFDEIAKTMKNEQQNLNLLKHNGKVTIKMIEEMIKEASKSGSKLVVLDHLHYFDSSDQIQTDRHDLIIKDIMHRINHLARAHNICVILVAHYTKLSRGQKPSLNEFSGSISIAQVVNGIIHIWRDKDKPELDTEFIIDKNRDMGITKTITANFNLDTYEYEFSKSELQRGRAL